MQRFDTPNPITVALDITLGDVRIIASDRADTTVEVRASDENKAADDVAADATRVEFTGNRLVVKGPKQGGLWSLGKLGSVDVVIELPTGSDVRGDAAMADFRVEGRLGECMLKTASGDVDIDEAGAVRLSSASGRVTVDHVVGDVAVTAGSGEVRVRVVEGSTLVKSSNGDTWIGEAMGDVRLQGANGDLLVDRAHANVTAKTANGRVRVGEVVRGSAVLETMSGDLEVGIRKGSAAWLDLSSVSGVVSNSLESAEGPDESDEKVEIRAKTVSGDIVVRRAAGR